MTKVKVTVTIEVDGVALADFNPLVLRQTVYEDSIFDTNVAVSSSAYLGYPLGLQGENRHISTVAPLSIIAVSPNRALTVMPEAGTFYLNPGGLFLMVDMASPFGPPQIGNFDTENVVPVRGFVGGGDEVLT